jgi:hypothetical protein
MAYREKTHQGVCILYDEQDENYYKDLVRLNEQCGNALFAVTRGSQEQSPVLPSLQVSILLVGARRDDGEEALLRNKTRRMLLLHLPTMEEDVGEYAASMIEAVVISPVLTWDPLYDNEEVERRFGYLPRSMVDRLKHGESFSIVHWNNIIHRPREFQLLIEIARNRVFLRGAYLDTKYSKQQEE